MGNGMNKILPGVYVGSVMDAHNRKQMTTNGITHVLSVHEGAKPVFNDRVYKCIHAVDSSDQDLSQYFSECNDFIHQSRVSGGIVLLHCVSGISRIVTIMVAYIMAVTSLDWETALTAVQARRPRACPNSGFRVQLINYQKTRAAMEGQRLAQQYPCITFQDEAYLCDVLKEYEGSRAHKMKIFQAEVEERVAKEWSGVDPCDVPIEGEEEEEEEEEALEPLV